MAIRILVVDDAGFIRDMVKKQLRERIPGVEVSEAVDGNRALAALKQQHVDLILSDWEMPNMSGEELLRHVRAQPENTDIPFIMVTSRGDRSHVVKAVEAGASDYLVKPFTPEELLRKVGKQLTRIGKGPKTPAQPGSQGSAAGSVGVLTGGRGAGASGAPQGGAAAPSRKLKGQAQLRVGNRGEVLRCVLRELSLEAMTGLIQRPEAPPRLFDPVVVDIEPEQEDAPSQLNGYIHSLQAAEATPDTQVIRLVVRFVDQDSDKQAALTRFLKQT
ncbi:response regulator [Marinimicrobium locisalis]|uniref:response regulator n=1 Tax=Marinimicrobium locisalis TaxID=546022 RepID=UPI0032218E18